METYILLQDKHASAPKRTGLGVIAAASKALAALSITGTLMLALLPAGDLAAVQQALALTTTSPDGLGRSGDDTARA